MFAARSLEYALEIKDGLRSAYDMNGDEGAGLIAFRSVNHVI